MIMDKGSVTWCGKYEEKEKDACTFQIECSFLFGICFVFCPDITARGRTNSVRR